MSTGFAEVPVPVEGFKFISEVVPTFNQLIIPQRQANLLCVGPRCGLVFVACGNIIKVFKTETLLACSEKLPLTEFVTPGIVSHIQASSDGLTFAASVDINNQSYLLFYDNRCLTPQAANITPFAHKLLASPINALAWNPVDPQVIALTTDQGDLMIVSLGENNLQFKELQNLNACALGWSPKGKQLTVGLLDGSLQLYKPDLTFVRRVEPPKPAEGLPAVSKVLSITWFSNSEFFVGFKLEGEDGGQIMTYIVAPKGQPTKCVVFDFFCNLNGGNLSDAFYPIFITEWNILFVLCSRDMKLGVLGLDPARPDVKVGSWREWEMEEGYQALIHNAKLTDDSFPMALALDFTSQKIFTKPDGSTHGPYPVLYSLSTGGEINIFHIVNEKFHCGTMALSLRAEELPKIGLRSSEKFNCGELMIPTIAGNAVAGCAEKENSVGVTRNENSSPMGLMDGKIGTAIGGKVKPAIDGAVGSMVGTVTGMVAPTKFRIPALSQNSPLSMDSRPLAQPKSTLGTFGVKPVSAQTSGPFATVASKRGSVSTASQQHPVSTSHALAPSQSFVQMDESMFANVQQLLKTFEQEMLRHHEANRNINCEVGSSTDMGHLRSGLNELQDWVIPLQTSMESLVSDTTQLHSTMLEGYNMQEEASSHLCSRIARRDAHSHHHSLDPASRRRLMEIRSLHQYLQSQLVEVNTTMELKWATLMDQSSRRRPFVAPVSDSLYGGLMVVRNTRLSAQVEVERLCKRIRNVQVTCLATCTNSSLSANDNGQNLLDQLEKSFREATIVGSEPSGKCLSPTKHAKVREALAKRHSVPVRSPASSGVSPRMIDAHVIAGFQSNAKLEYQTPSKGDISSFGPHTFSTPVVSGSADAAQSIQFGLMNKTRDIFSDGAKTFPQYEDISPPPTPVMSSSTVKWSAPLSSLSSLVSQVPETVAVGMKGDTGALGGTFGSVSAGTFDTTAQRAFTSLATTSPFQSLSMSGKNVAIPSTESPHFASEVFTGMVANDDISSRNVVGKAPTSSLLSAKTSIFGNTGISSPTAVFDSESGASCGQLGQLLSSGSSFQPVPLSPPLGKRASELTDYSTNASQCSDHLSPSEESYSEDESGDTASEENSSGISIIANRNLDTAKFGFGATGDPGLNVEASIPKGSNSSINVVSSNAVRHVLPPVSVSPADNLFGSTARTTSKSFTIFGTASAISSPSNLFGTTNIHTGLPIPTSKLPTPGSSTMTKMGSATLSTSFGNSAAPTTTSSILVAVADSSKSSDSIFSLPSTSASNTIFGVPSTHAKSSIASISSVTTNSKNIRGSIFATASAPAATESGSIFGITSTPATTSSGSIFGITSTPATTSSGSIFGITSTPVLTGNGSIFGTASTPAATGSGSIFGRASTPTATGSIFGIASTPAAATGNGSIFGIPTTPFPTSSGSIFGIASTPATTSSGSIFATASTPAATGSGSILVIESTPATTSSVGAINGTSITGSGSIFGAASSPATVVSGNLFGGTVTPATGSSGNLISMPAPHVTTGSGSIFGVATTPTTAISGTIFGVVSTPAKTGSGSIFGAISVPSTTGSLFGVSSASTSAINLASETATGSTSSIFGGPTSPAPTNGLFGGALSAAISTSSIFGGATTIVGNSLFGVSVPSTSNGSSFTGTPTAAPTAGIFGGMPAAAAPATGIFAGTSATAPTAGIFGGMSSSTTPNAIFGGATFGTSGQSTGFGLTSNSATSTVSFAPPTTQLLFGQSSSPSVFGGQTSVFGEPASTSGSVFGDKLTASTGFTSGSVFGGQSAFLQSPFSSASGTTGDSTGAPFGSGSGGMDMNGMGGGDFFSGLGLGGKASAEASSKNIFGGSSTFGSASPQTGLFGSPLASAGSVFGGSGQVGTSVFPSSADTGAVARSGFGGFTSQQAGSGFASTAFGGSPTFCSTPAFGSVPTFGSPTKFGAAPIFGGSPFSSPQSNSTGGFSAFASSGTTFGAIAANASEVNSSSGFGNFGNTTPFGNLPQQQTEPNSFGSTPSFGGGGAFSSWRS